jgi:apolipoprotein N-acyltransferase
MASKLTLPTSLNGRDIRDIVLSSVCLILSYAPSPFGFLIFFAFVPQLFLYTRNNPLRSALFGYLIGLIVNSCVLYWLLFYAGSGFSIIVILNALQFAVLGGTLSAINHNKKKIILIVFPFLWTFLEYTRQLGDLAFNWLNIAFTQTYFLHLIQFLDITGQSGVVFWICVINVYIYLILKNRFAISTVVRFSTVVAFLFLLPLLYGFYRMSDKPVTEGVSVAYIQPNIDLNQKWDSNLKQKNLGILLSLTDSILITDPDLIVWPETAIPYYLEDNKSDLIKIQSHTDFYNYHLLTGVIDYSFTPEGKKKHNAVYYFATGDSSIKRYLKLLLVPGEETWPLHEYLPGWISRFENQPLSPGSEAVLFKMKLIPYQVEYKGQDWQITGRMDYVKSLKVGTVICYESVFPNIVQRFMDQGCEMLVVVTNDSWFDYTSQPFQHLQSVVLRAIEQRISVIRCANTGISSFIDPYGRKYLEAPIFSKSSAQKVIPVRRLETFYSQYGDIVGIISGIFMISFLILQVLNLRWKLLPNSYRNKVI